MVRGRLTQPPDTTEGLLQIDAGTGIAFVRERGVLPWSLVRHGMTGWDGLSWGRVHYHQVTNYLVPGIRIFTDCRYELCVSADTWIYSTSGWVRAGDVSVGVGLLLHKLPDPTGGSGDTALLDSARILAAVISCRLGRVKSFRVPQGNVPELMQLKQALERTYPEVGSGAKVETRRDTAVFKLSMASWEACRRTDIMKRVEMIPKLLWLAGPEVLRELVATTMDLGATFTRSRVYFRVPTHRMALEFQLVLWWFGVRAHRIRNPVTCDLVMDLDQYDALMAVARGHDYLRRRLVSWHRLGNSPVTPDAPLARFLEGTSIERVRLVEPATFRAVLARMEKGRALVNGFACSVRGEW